MENKIVKEDNVIVLGFDELMEVVNGNIQRKGQNGKPSVISSQNFYFGEKFGDGLDAEELVVKCEALKAKMEDQIKNLDTIIQNKSAERDAIVAENLGNKVKKLGKLSPANRKKVIDMLLAEDAAEANANAEAVA